MFCSTILLLVYFLPTILALHRRNAAGGMFVLNLLFGWTGIGWLALIAWAVSMPDYRYRTNYYYGYNSYPAEPYSPRYNAYAPLYCRTCWRPWW